MRLVPWPSLSLTPARSIGLEFRASGFAASLFLLLFVLLLSAPPPPSFSFSHLFFGSSDFRRTTFGGKKLFAAPAFFSVLLLLACVSRIIGIFAPVVKDRRRRRVSFCYKYTVGQAAAFRLPDPPTISRCVACKSAFQIWCSQFSNTLDLERQIQAHLRKWILSEMCKDNNVLHNFPTFFDHYVKCEFNNPASSYSVE